MAAVASSSSTADTKAAANASSQAAKKSAWETEQQVLVGTLWEVTAGIPRRELKLMVSEANECEKALQDEIKALEQALQATQEDAKAAVDPKIQALLDSPFTPMDRHWTLSALLGRLRGELSPPTLVSVQAGNPSAPLPAGATVSTARRLLEMRHKAAYRREHATAATLLPTWKKIFSNRLAIVFKKPVRDEDAPGYSARIRFPMDLSLVRKFIVSRHIKSLADLHVYVGLIAHNCVKYNGRETDYGIVAREFEEMSERIILEAVMAEKTKAAPAAAAAAASATVAAASAPASDEKKMES